LVEPFKNLLDAAGVRAIARHLHRAGPGFDARRFERRALAGLDALELAARVRHIADALEAAMPDDFARAAERIEASLGPAGGPDDPAPPRTGEAGLAGWPLWPIGEYVARRGLATPGRALQTLQAITRRFTAEFAIRPFIVAHPALTFATLQQWTRDPSAHVRRLVSEGSRPRLPWGLRLKSLIADPSPTLPLLRALQDVPSAYVRRSVANHLNDIAKDHPAIVVRWLAEHLPGASPERRALLRHASRTLIKQGHPAVMKHWGLGRRFAGEVRLAVSPATLRIGETLTLDLRLTSAAARTQPLQIDYAVHHVKAAGHTTAKVFKGWSLSLAAQETRTLHKRHSMRVVSTRRYHPGRHEVDVRINGEVRARSFFDLAAAQAAPAADADGASR
jgi:3-methyladenine DNA glycosylase AlkC